MAVCEWLELQWAPRCKDRGSSCTCVTAVDAGAVWTMCRGCVNCIAAVDAAAVRTLCGGCANAVAAVDAAAVNDVRVLCHGCVGAVPRLCEYADV